jgi:hypothetical protein
VLRPPRGPLTPYTRCVATVRDCARSAPGSVPEWTRSSGQTTTLP